MQYCYNDSLRIIFVYLVFVLFLKSGATQTIYQCLQPGYTPVIVPPQINHFCTSSIDCDEGATCMTPSVEATFKICCASTLSASCPSNYSPALDLQMRKIHCSSTNSNVCPQMSECLQSATQSTVYICCKSNESPRICPNNQNALITNGMLETCSGPQNSCSQINYSCQYSTIVSSWVCCGRGSAGVPTCRNGDQPYSTIAVEIFRCSLITQNCIFGYVCEPSTVPTVNVCCPSGFVSTVTPPSPCSSTLIPPVLNCPSNWTPYKYSNGNYHLCNSVADRDSCPVGFSCTPANIQSLFLCCRLSIVFECPPGTSSLIVNNQPRLCSQTSIRSCPPQYQCLQSTYGNINICCSVDSLNCINGRQVERLNGNPRHCNTLGMRDSCAFGYLCDRSNIDNLYVCCNIS